MNARQLYGAWWHTIRDYASDMDKYLSDLPIAQLTGREGMIAQAAMVSWQNRSLKFGTKPLTASGRKFVQAMQKRNAIIPLMATPAKAATARRAVALVARAEGAWATLTFIKFAGFGHGSWWSAMVDGVSVPLTGADIQRLRSAGHRLPAGSGAVNISVRLWADIRSGQDALCDVEAV